MTRLISRKSLNSVQVARATKAANDRGATFHHYTDGDGPHSYVHMREDANAATIEWVETAVCQAMNDTMTDDELIELAERGLRGAPVPE